jgi:hypothetical protein
VKDGALGGMCVGDIIIGDMLPTAKRGEPAGTLRGEWPGEQGPTRYVLVPTGTVKVACETVGGAANPYCILYI